jgi:hypothetical protein
MRSQPIDAGPSPGAALDSEDPEQIPSRRFTALVFVSLFLSLGAIALLCVEHHVTVLEQRLEVPAELP